MIFWNLNIKWGLTVNGNQTSLAQVHLKYYFLSSAAIVKLPFIELRASQSTLQNGIYIFSIIYTELK